MGRVCLYVSVSPPTFALVLCVVVATFLSVALIMLSLHLLALLALAGANSVPATTPAPALCPAVTKLVTSLKQQKPASAFCSSYLGIPIITTTATQTNTMYDELNATNTAIACLLMYSLQCRYGHDSSLWNCHCDISNCCYSDRFCVSMKILKPLHTLTDGHQDVDEHRGDVCSQAMVYV